MSLKRLFGFNPTPLLVVLLVASAFVIGMLWTKVQIFEGGAVVKPTPVVNSGTGGAKETGEVKPLGDNDHVLGERSARVLLIEYSDLECPFCKRFHPTAKQAVGEFKGQVAWVYRHFPLDQIHSKADKEAEATECAGELGGEEKFWAMTDKIFEVTPSNNGLNIDDLPKLASQVGLNQGKFKNCLDSGKYAQRVEDDYQGGVTAGITGTPGNILLDTKTGKTKLVPGAVPFEDLKKSIDSLLAQS